MAPTPSASRNVDAVSVYRRGGSAEMVQDAQRWLDEPASKPLISQRTRNSISLDAARPDEGSSILTSTR